MKKVFLFLAVLLVSCFPSHIENDIKELKQERAALRREKQALVDFNDNMRSSKSELEEEVALLRAEKGALANGREPKYIITLEIKQGTFTLDIGEHIKNNINKVKMDIPVSRDFFDSVYTGTEINKSFKYGSLFFNGDFSELKVKIIGKRIE